MKRAMQPFNLDPLIVKPTELRSLQQVKVPDIFEGSSQNFHAEGLFSTTIFGNVGTEQRDNRGHNGGIAKWHRVRNCPP